MASLARKLVSVRAVALEVTSKVFKRCAWLHELIVNYHEFSTNHYSKGKVLMIN